MAAKMKTGRGGPRPGSGRKPTPVEERQRNRVMFTLTDAELEALVKASRGQAFSPFVRQIVLRYLGRRR
jgi:hypothetical protein